MKLSVQTRWSFAVLLAAVAAVLAFAAHAPTDATDLQARRIILYVAPPGEEIPADPAQEA